MFKKNKQKNIVAIVAEQYGESEQECRLAMEQAIEDMQYSDDPEERAEFIRLFGNKTPSVEEFVYKTTIDIRKGLKKKSRLW